MNIAYRVSLSLSALLFSASLFLCSMQTAHAQGQEEPTYGIAVREIQESIEQNNGPSIQGGVIQSDQPCEGGEIHDDGTLENGYGWQIVVSDGRFVELFRPQQYPFLYTEVCVCWTRNTGFTTLDFEVVFYDTLGPGGAPGNLLGSVPATIENVPAYPAGKFITVDVTSANVVIPQGNVFIGVRWNPNAFPGFFVCVDESPTTPLQIGGSYDNLTGFWIPTQFQLPFIGYRALLVRADGIEQVLLNTDLTLMPLDLDLRQDTDGPISTKAKFDIWNQNEVRFSGTERCITCWDQALLSRYGFANHFFIDHLHTDRGQARIDGLSSTQCPSSEASPMVGLAIKEMFFNNGLMESAATPVGIGTETARIQYDVIAPPDTALGGWPVTDAAGSMRFGPGKSDGSGRPSGSRRSSDDESEDGSELSTTSLALGERVGSISQKGSLLVWAKAELVWDVNGRLIQDTFIDLSNDLAEDVYVQFYFVNGDLPTEAVFAGDPPVMMERAHSGWNNVDAAVQLTANQPLYWSVASGLPAGVQPFPILDPGFPPGRPDPLGRGPGWRVLRGFIVGWAVDSRGHEIQWNHLTGDATVVNYAYGSAYEYNAWAFQCLVGNEDGDVCGPVAGDIHLDGVEYEACPARLLLNFYSVGSQAFSPADGVPGLPGLVLENE